jgi:hypothetical protein
MSDVHQLIVQIKKPDKRFPLGQVCYGWYTLVDGVITMTDRNGKAAGDETGKKYTRKLEPNEDARHVA